MTCIISDSFLYSSMSKVAISCSIRYNSSRLSWVPINVILPIWKSYRYFRYPVFFLESGKKLQRTAEERGGGEKHCPPGHLLWWGQICRWVFSSTNQNIIGSMSQPTRTAQTAWVSREIRYLIRQHNSNFSRVLLQARSLSKSKYFGRQHLLVIQSSASSISQPANS